MMKLANKLLWLSATLAVPAFIGCRDGSTVNENERNLAAGKADAGTQPYAEIVPSPDTGMNAAPPADTAPAGEPGVAAGDNNQARPNTNTERSPTQRVGDTADRAGDKAERKAEGAVTDLKPMNDTPITPTPPRGDVTPTPARGDVKKAPTPGGSVMGGITGGGTARSGGFDAKGTGTATGDAGTKPSN